MGVILSLDELSLNQGLELASKVGNRAYAMKIHNLYDQEGPGVVKRFLDAGARRVWVDYKLHDIPNTVRIRAKEIAESGASILSVHASGEIDMMMDAVEAGPPEIYAITVLTSLDEEQAELLHGHPPKASALYLARLAKLAGVHGVVSSPKEVGTLAKRRELIGLKLITPGVRSPGAATDDQQRVDTPAAAVASGSTHIVVGRQVTQAEDQVRAFDQIEKEIS